MKSLDTGKADQLTELEAVLNYSFKDKTQVRLALTHTSARMSKLADYERLEFLGDRVLGLLVAEELLKQFPKDKEGDLAKRLAQLVRKETLAEVAASLKLGDYIVLSQGENASGGRENPSVLSDVCEALIAAIYLDGGLEAAGAFVLPNWLPLIVGLTKPPRDAKTELQEWAQGKSLGLPKYRISLQTGPSHNPEFEVEVTVPGFEVVAGQGRSKRQAEQSAAKSLLTIIKASKKEKKRKKLKLPKQKSIETKAAPSAEANKA